MIRGAFLSRSAAAGIITFTLFIARALSTYTMNPVISVLIDPLIVFIMFVIAGLIITYPYLKGWRAFVVAPLMIVFVLFFVYTYYIL